MIKKIRAVLFDLDGTLIDSAPDFIPAVNQLRAEHKLAALDEARIRATVSNGARALVSLALGAHADDKNFKHDDFEKNRQRFLEIYTENLGRYSHAFDGMRKLLSELKKNNILWGIATNKPERYTLPLLKKLNFLPAPNCVICPDHVIEPKPHPASLQLACQQLNCNSEELIYIGDHRRDIDCGKHAGAITIAALYGYIENGDNPDDWGADYSVNRVEELWPLIQTIDREK